MHCCSTPNTCMAFLDSYPSAIVDSSMSQSRLIPRPSYNPDLFPTWTESDAGAEDELRLVSEGQPPE